MSPHPDLTNPALPDTDDLDRRKAGPSMSLRNDDFEWPESGPSSRPMGDESRKAKVGPFGAKAVAAMTGAVTTSLLMTPFDVLKTRLQTVRPNLRNSNPNPTAPIPTTSECCQTSILTDPKISKPSNPNAINPLTCLTSTSTSPAIAMNPSSSSSTSTLSAMKAPEGCAYPSKWAGIWGENVLIQGGLGRSASGLGTGMGMEGGMGAGALVLPLRGNIRLAESGMGVGAEQSLAGGFWDEVAAVRRETGVRGLWKGVGTTLTMSIPSAAIYMLGYEHLLSTISPFFTHSNDPRANTSSLNRPRPVRLQNGEVDSGVEVGVRSTLTPAPLIAGSLARTFSASVISPIEMFRTRLQALPSVERGTPTYASTSKELVHLVKTEGLTILWRGLGPTLWRDVPFSGIYWAGFEILKTSLSTSQPDLSPLTTSFLSGALSGTVAAIVTQPFDVLKTRRQVFTPSKDCTGAARAGTLPLAMHVYRTEGGGALFAGLAPRCGKVAMACGLMIACYEGVGRWLGGEGEAAGEDSR